MRSVLTSLLAFALAMLSASVCTALRSRVSKHIIEGAFRGSIQQNDGELLTQRQTQRSNDMDEIDEDSARPRSGRRSRSRRSRGGGGRGGRRSGGGRGGRRSRGGRRGRRSGGGHRGRPSRGERRGRRSGGGNLGNLKLVMDCTPSNFMSCWNGFTKPDPTHGISDYKKGWDMRNQLISTSHGNITIKLGKANGHKLVPAIRLHSKKTFDVNTVWVVDVVKIPVGPGLWPAYWSTGTKGTWPASGEIDMMESVNNDSKTMISTLHTTDGCSMKTVSGISNGGKCNANHGYSGCGVHANRVPNGPELNKVGGGIHVAQWDTKGIKMWWINRTGNAQFSADVLKTQPYVFFPFTNCPSSHFQQHVYVINLALCGDWAGSVYHGGLSKCESDIRGGKNNFESDSFVFKSIRAYTY